MQNIVKLSEEEKSFVVEIAKAMRPYEGDVARAWEEVYNKSGMLDDSSRSVKDYPGTVRLFLTSLSDGDFDGYFSRIEDRGVDLAKTKEQYENLILSFHLYEDASYEYLRKLFKDDLGYALGTLDHLYHNVIALLARAYFKELEKEKEALFSLVAHDIGNPLTVIDHSIDMILDKRKKGISDKEQENVYLGTAKEHTEKSLNIVKNIVGFGYLTSGKYDLNPSRFDIWKAVTEAALLLLHEAGKREISVFIGENDLRNLTTPPPFEVYTSRDLIIKVIDSYISNAIKRANSRVTILVQDANKDIWILVQDDGTEIPNDELGVMFDKYIGKNNSIGGIGLGLASVHVIAELLQGSAWATSESGKGTTFYFQIPKIQQVKHSK